MPLSVDFHDVFAWSRSELGIWLSIHEYGGRIRPMLKGSWIHEHPICLQAKEQQLSNCIQMDAKFINQGKANETAHFWKTCHANVTEFCRRITFQDRPAGMLFAGPFRLAEGSPLDPNNYFCLPTTTQPNSTADLQQAPILNPTNRLRCENFCHLVANSLELALVENAQLQLEPMDDRAAVIQRFISNHFSEAPKLDDLASHLHLSSSRTSHLLRELFNCTFPQLLLKRRLEQARHLLIWTNLSMEQIASKCAFGDLSHFYRCFKKHANNSPAQWRKLSIQRKKLELVDST